MKLIDIVSIRQLYELNDEINSIKIALHMLLAGGSEATENE
jgi:hypothetical protein